MSKQKQSKSNSEKTLRKQVAAKLASSFPEIKENTSEKRFDKKIKKASKVLAAGIDVNKEKTTKAAPVSKAAKKTAKKVAPAKAKTK